MSEADELARIRREYERRARDPRYPSLYGENPAVSAALTSRKAAALALLARHGLDRLHGLRTLDVGCGGGGELRRLVEWGADERLLAGIDLMPDRIAAARLAVPRSTLILGNAAALPWRSEVFDLALCFTVFSSVLDGAMRCAIATEIARVLRPGGGLLWYDFKWNPANRQTVGVGAKEVRQLLPGFTHDVRSITLAPPIARIVAPRAPALASLLERVPMLRSHTIGLAIKPEGSDP